MAVALVLCCAMVCGTTLAVLRQRKVNAAAAEFATSTAEAVVRINKRLDDHNARIRNQADFIQAVEDKAHADRKRLEALEAKVATSEVFR